MLVKLLLSLGLLLTVTAVQDADARGFGGGFAGSFGGGVSAGFGRGGYGYGGAMNLYRPYGYGYGYPYGYGYGGDYGGGYFVDDPAEEDYDATHNSDGSLIGGDDAGPGTNNPPAPTTATPAVSEADRLQSADQNYNWGSTKTTPDHPPK